MLRRDRRSCGGLLIVGLSVVTLVSVGLRLGQDALLEAVGREILSPSAAPAAAALSIPLGP